MLIQRIGYRKWIALFLVGWMPRIGHAFLNSAALIVEEKIAAVEQQLATLPKTTHTSAPWTLGYHFIERERKTVFPVVIEIVFTEVVPLDLLVLMPVVYVNENGNLESVAFPEQFMLEIVHPDESVSLIADFRETPYPTPGVEPQLFSCATQKACAGIRITNMNIPHNNRFEQQPNMLGLSEVMAFSGEWNVALNARVIVPRDDRFGYTWAPDCLVDGFSFFSPLDHKIIDPHKIFHAVADSVELLFDLGEEQTVEELRLWPIRFSLFMQFPTADGTSFPRKIRLEKLNTPDDQHPQLLYQSGSDFPRPGSSPFMRSFPASTGRYFRLTLSDPLPDFRTGYSRRISLAEVELFGHGALRTRGKIAELNLFDSLPAGREDVEALTDGLSNEGRVLPLKQWVIQFKLRTELERQLAGLQSELEFARGLDEKRNELLSIGALIIIFALILMVWVVRLLSERRWSLMREQIAADLHDEIGANLGSIAHSTELIKELLPSATNKIQTLLGNTLATARMTADETRRFVRFLEDRESGIEATGHIRQTADRILGNIEFICKFNETRFFNLLNPARKWDLLFFIKEALNNVRKHSGASHVEIITQCVGHYPQVVISDNGKGLPSYHQSLRHLESRAKRLKGRLTIETGPDQGTRITLTLTKKKL